ncbi:MAG: tRNA pseudouridine(38-40) synthase TruA [Gammaproteobacteria bacterium]|nr:tRNA pseudouridine(38-40) synthase TruA [Gammaproteobacteria bacterium]
MDSNKRRIVATVEYDGSRFLGWQRQLDDPTVQAELENALSRVANEPTKVTAAGRTDSGVHACGQVIHFDSTQVRSGDNWLRGTNTLLPDGIAVLGVQEISSEFNARYSALSRSYRYVIFKRKMRPTYLQNYVTWDYRQLDPSAMHNAAQTLLGEHDFNAFRASSCQAKSAVREITSIQVNGSGNWVWIDISANGFLHHMVRNIAGVLMAIGAGEKSAHWIKTILESKDRTQGGKTAPAQGLYLTKVNYTSEYRVPEPSEPCRFW